MRILNLELRAFGCFTGVTLDLSEEGRTFHLIYGANEAGKSTALRAITGLLYGIPGQTEDGFLHKYVDLRVAAHLQNLAGNSFQFVRRKGNKNTLLDLDDNPLPDTFLQACLGGISEEVFSTMFGLNHPTLQGGGRDLLEGHGDVAESLFEAGTGITGLHQILKGLENEAGQLFTVRRSNSPLINDKLIIYNETQNNVNAWSFAAGKWKRQEDDLKKKEADLEVLKDQLRELDAEKSRLERFKHALPHATQWKMLRAELEALGEVTVLPSSAARDREESCRTLRESQTRKREIEERIAALQKQLDDLQVPRTLLESADEITVIHEKLGSHRKAALDLPAVRAEQQGLAADARSILGEIRPDLTLEQVESLRLTTVQRTRIQLLAGKQGTLQERLRVAEEKVESVGAELKDKKQTLEQTVLPGDPEELQRAVERAGEQGQLEAQLKQETTQLAAQEEQAAVDLQRLGRWSGTLDELERLVLPSTETIEDFDGRFASMKTRQDDRRNRLEEEREKREHIKHNIQALHLDGEVPTEEELVQARTRREQGWQSAIRLIPKIGERRPSPMDYKGLITLSVFLTAFLLALSHGPQKGWDSGYILLLFTVAALSLFFLLWLVRRAWLDGLAEPDEAHNFDPDRALAKAFEKCMTQDDEADEVVDRLRREAKRVAQRDDLLAEKESCKQKLTRLQEETDGLRRDAETLDQQWRAVWEPAGITPLLPKEMRGWLSRQTTLVERSREMRLRRQTRVQLEQRIQEHRNEIGQALEQLGDPGIRDHESLADLLKRSRAHLKAIDKTTTQRDQLETDVARLTTESEKAEHESVKAQKALNEWRNEWVGAIKVLELPSESDPDEVMAVLGRLAELFKKVEESRDRGQRIEGMERDTRQFKEDVVALATSVAPNLMIGLPAEQAAQQLHLRLGKARENAATRKQLEEQLEDKRHEQEACETAAQKAERRLNELMDQACCNDLKQLEEAEKKSNILLERKKQFKEVEALLAEDSAGSTLEQLIQEIEGIDGDRLPSQIDELHQHIQKLEDERSPLEQQVGSDRTALKAIDGSDAAAAAAEEAQRILAEIRSGTERYLRLRLACELLRRQIELYREQNQDPVIRQAGEFFARLTLGSFSNLKTGFDEKDNPILLGVRRSGAEVDVTGMSDGTRDQLYLSLRIASLEKQLESGEPLPLIVDDILINFDDERSRATLSVLAELCRKTQVLFFTHHARLVELAQEVVPASCLAVHDLSQLNSTVARAGLATML